MTTIILAILLGGCILSHFFMMRKSNHDDLEIETDKKVKKDTTHTGGGCCH